MIHNNWCLVLWHLCMIHIINVSNSWYTINISGIHDIPYLWLVSMIHNIYVWYPWHNVLCQVSTKHIVYVSFARYKIVMSGSSQLTKFTSENLLISIIFVHVVPSWWRHQEDSFSNELSCKCPDILATLMRMCAVESSSKEEANLLGNSAQMKVR